MDIYHHYKPLRNHLKSFSLQNSLIDIWSVSNHIVENMPLLQHIKFSEKSGKPISTRNPPWKIFPWELETLARELIINAENTIGNRFSRIQPLTKSIQIIRDIENEISKNEIKEKGDKYNVLDETHRLSHRQIIFQQPLTTRRITRYFKIFSHPALAQIVEDKVKMTVTQFLQLGYAVSGNFLTNWGINASQSYEHLGISKEQSDGFYNLISIPLSTLKNDLIKKSSMDRDWLYTVNPLEARPLLALSNEQPEQLICPIPIFLIRRITSGLYYDLYSHNKFANPFGTAFQDYIGSVIEYSLRNKEYNLLPEKKYILNKKTKDGMDWILFDNTANLFIECKTKRLPHSEKYLLIKNELDEQLDVLAKAIHQNYANISDSLNGHTHWENNNLPSYSVITTLEQWFQISPTLLTRLQELVKKRLNESGINENILDRVPYIVCSAEEFEDICYAIKSDGIENVFSKLTSKDHFAWSVSGIISQNFKNLNLRELFIEDFQSLLSSILNENTAASRHIGDAFTAAQ
ncbi:hypothetical protein [Janthinobacterium fluminis]|uniref:Uncharacterized protein n=1 Tax=Janthinobacterium fluminis TaxID=2987524 RepID=A0ABT5JY38_9BURK|nr:hypothetical protein [Janthinobacterium fluminis]MDC8757484.1 hypothetical protein [Janthinobacterium fluminis]